MRIYGNCWPTKGGVEHHVGCFAANAGQSFKRSAVFWHFTIMLIKQDPAGLNDIFCFAIIQADGFDVLLDAINAQFEQRRRGICHRI